MSIHEPVLTAEALTYLAADRGGLFVDCTVGLGGHARALLEAGASRVIGLDRDTDALAIAADSLAAFGDRVELVHADYRSLGDVLAARGIQTIDGRAGRSRRVVAAVRRRGPGLQLPPRRAARHAHGPQHRADCRRPASRRRRGGARQRHLRVRRGAAFAADRARDRRHSRRGSRSRRRASSRRSSAARCRPAAGSGSIPATRTFQALRIWVNRELDGLDTFLRGIVDRLRDGGRVVVISFHSLEDRIVKHTFRALERAEALVRVLTKRPVVPGRRGNRPQSPRAERQAARGGTPGACGRERRRVMEAFDYAISKDIRNNQIVREIDHSRHRELWRWTAIGTVIVGLLVYSAWQHFELLRHGYRVEQMERAPQAGSGDQPPPPAADPDAQGAAAHRQDRHRVSSTWWSPAQPTRSCSSERYRSTHPPSPSWPAASEEASVSEHAPEPWRRTIRRRLAVVLVLFGAWCAAIEARLVYLQVYQHDAYVARAERQHKRTVEVAAKRGEILDRNDRVLAFSVDADSIYAVPSEIREPEKIVTALCGALRGMRREFRAALRERLGRRAGVRVGEAPGLARRGAEGRGSRARGRRLHQGEPPVLPEHLAGGARRRLRRPRQPGAGRDRSGVTTR